MKKQAYNIFWIIFNIFFIIIIAGIIVNTYITYSDISEKDDIIHNLQAKETQLREQHNNYKNAITEINKKEAKELIARNKLFMKKKGEKIYRIRKNDN